MSKGYWVSAHRNLPDSDKYEAYAKLAVPAIEQNGGRILVRAITETAVENGLTGFRTVVIEFDSYEKAVAAYHSENYQNAVKELGGTQDRDFRIVEGN
ncbi:MAG: hypothetical protein CMM35_12695 [Rhodospirillaceae bacterium]|jgi:uncharacterized protein (DUF1330 family)|nr:hypothetical protein [Rhodospirillaceae bacterium]|tara:strand:- start:1826 stop:2119 length:294 start_codon:yes stop_codon:yes gene_type:complete